MGAAQRGRVVDAIADHRHNFAGAHQRVDDLVLLFGLHAREDIRAARQLGGPLRAQTSQFRSIYDQAVVMEDTGSFRHGVSRKRMVAGYELDPGRLTLVDRGWNFGTQRITKAQQPVQDKVAFIFFAHALKAAPRKRPALGHARGAGVGGIAAGGEAARDRDHAHALAGEFRVHRMCALALAGREPAVLQDPFQRAFGHDASGGGGAITAGRAHPDVGHVLADDVEGVVVSEPPTIVQRFDIDAMVAAVRQDFALQRIHRARFAG